MKHYYRHSLFIVYTRMETMDTFIQTENISRATNSFTCIHNSKMFSDLCRSFK